MAESSKFIKGYVQQKHDTFANWEKATTFVPAAGQIIVYDDGKGNENKPKIKIGDDIHNPHNLPFSGGEELIAGDNITIDNNTISATDTTYGLASTTGAGLLRSLSGNSNEVLLGDGSWGTNPTNQTIKGNGTAFGANDAVDIVAGSNVTVTPNTTNKTITIAAIGTKPNDAKLTLQVAGTTKTTFTADDADDATFNVTAADLGLSQALVFKGITTTNLTDEATTSPITMDDGSSLTPAVGNVVITKSTVSSLPNTEFVWANSKWNKLGDAKSYALNSVTVTGAGVLGGGGNLTANRTITHNAGNAASKAEGLYKISTDAYSHVNSATAVTKADITALGIPGSDTNTTYSLTQDATDGHKITLTPSSGTAQTITIPDNNTQYTAGTGLTLSGTQFKHSNAVTAGTASEGGSARTLAFGGTFNVPSVTYDAQGHVTSKGSTTLTMPANPNTDTKVTAVGNHYTPSGGTATTPTSSGTATRGSTVVMTGITKDAAGHVTGVTGYTLPASDNTDTKNTAGSTDTSSKIFLVGATSQAANPQTYSDNQVYATNGQLDANKIRIAEAVSLVYDSTNKCLNFNFA